MEDMDNLFSRFYNVQYAKELLLPHLQKNGLMIAQKAYDYICELYKTTSPRKYLGLDAIIHPINVANGLIDLKAFRLDDNMYAAALLHDVIEDFAGVRKDNLPFPDKVIDLVDLLTAKNPDGIDDDVIVRHEYFEALVLCPQALVIKDLDRIDNLRTMYVHKRDTIVSNVIENVHYLIPNTRKLGLSDSAYLDDCLFLTDQLRTYTCIYQNYLDAIR